MCCECGSCEEDDSDDTWNDDDEPGEVYGGVGVYYKPTGGGTGQSAAVNAGEGADVLE